MLTITGTPSDAELAGRVQDQDEAAFERLYDRYQTALIRHLDSIVQNEAAAQDLLQEVFLRVWERADQWNAQGSFRAWIYRIATNLALNHLRAQRRRQTERLEGADSSGWDEWSEEEPPVPGWMVDSSTLGPVELLEQAEKGARLRRAVAGLPSEKREVLRLVHEMELSIRDAAGQLGIPEGTVKSRLHYAQKQLTQAWRSLDTDLEDSE